MGKKKSKAPKAVWSCTDCGNETTGWFGRCPQCDAWGTIVESQPDEVGAAAGDRVRLSRGPAQATPANEARSRAGQTPRLQTTIGEFDRVLGGGLVPGSLVLLGGPPGIGKSTLLLQACAKLADAHGPLLYASGEESVEQVGGRAARLNADSDQVLLLAETRIETVMGVAEDAEPCALVVDSIQTMYSDSADGLPGNLGQIRSVTAHLMSWAKSRNIPVVVVGHVTKDGQLAGPRLLEHMVDAVLSFEGDDLRATRMLRATKNRFGSTDELGVFEMTGEGLREISNPSEAFLTDRPSPAVGSSVTATLEGSRPLLVEVQALLSPSPGGSPRRTCVGADSNRVAMFLAVLDRHAGVYAVDQDVFVNVAGGMRLREPATDLAVAMAIASSHLRKPLPQGTLVVGELSLTGELRRVPRLDARLREAERLGFVHALVPRGGRKPSVGKKFRLTEVRTLGEAIGRAFAE